MTNLIQFTIMSRWKHAKNGTGVMLRLQTRAEGEKDLRMAGVLSMTDAAWNMLQHQLCPSYGNDKCPVEVIEAESEW